MRAKILIVDDDRDILLSLENRVTWMGHEPLTADNGKDALRLIQEEEPDLVLLDLELPQLSGLEVLQKVNATSARHDPEDQPTSQPHWNYTTPLIVMLTRSPLGSGSRCRSILKSMALMIPSPNSSWISSLKVVP